MTSRRSSLAESINDVAISHARTPSNTSVFSLATPLSLAQPPSNKSQHSRHNFLRKLKNTKLGGHHHSRESSNEQWEWRCKGEDIENFEWPSEGYEERSRSTTPPLSPVNSRITSPRHASRVSSGSSISAASIATWPDDSNGGQAVVEEHGSAREQSRVEAEKAALEAIESFFVTKRMSMAFSHSVLEVEEDDFAIDLSAYDDPSCPSTFISAKGQAARPLTPVISRRPPPDVRTSFLSISSDGEADKPVVDFPISVIFPSTQQPDTSTRSVRFNCNHSNPSYRPTSAQSLPLPSTSSRHRRTPSPIPDGLGSRALPPLPRRRRPSSMMLPIAAGETDKQRRARVTASVAYSSQEIEVLRALKGERQEGSSYEWI